MSGSGITRRELMAGAMAAGVGLGSMAKAAPLQNRGKFLAVSSGNGIPAVDKAMELMRQGEDTLDAAIAGVNIVEDDPNDMSVGYGGLPNERGVVQLDFCCMHGPTFRAGAVASLENIKNPSRVAKLVMDRTDHVLMVGPGALEFAKMHGFKEENLLTEAARQRWVRWKESLSKDDDYLEPGENQPDDGPRVTGTITCLALNDKGDISGTTTTSGLAWKIPGRVGDSPIIGAGLYVDNEVGAAGSTGRGEACILIGGSRTVVENMRHGMSPQEAVMDVLERVCKKTVDPRLSSEPGKPNFQLQFYAISKDGRHAGGSILPGSRYAVHDGERSRLMACQSVF